MIRGVTPQDSDTFLEAAAESGPFSGEEIGALRQQLEKALGGAGDRAERWIAEFEGTQEFCRSNGYEHRGTIPDVYADGQDKIVFLERLD
ncbi:MAG: hypothetical protein AAF957_07240 [Planctomycetota bacterium]